MGFWVYICHYLLLVKSLVLLVKGANSLVDLGGYFMKTWIKDQSPNPAGKEFHNCSLLNTLTKVGLIFKLDKDRMVTDFTWTSEPFSHTWGMAAAVSLDHFWRCELDCIFLVFILPFICHFFISLLLTFLIAEWVLIQSLLHILVFQFGMTVYFAWIVCV